MNLLAAKVLAAYSAVRSREFFTQLGEKWLADLQNFLHTALPKIVITLIVAWVFLRILKLTTERMSRIAEARKGSGAAQVRTLASVTRATGIGIIGFLAALEILPLVGFKLEPLLASAGVAGVALGLAAQTIVKDCLNGILILVEDQYNVGDVVKIAGVAGTVEAMSLRKTQVRDGDGTLYIIPNSQITTVGNVTRDFSLATINVSVDYSADPDEVMKLLKDVAMVVRSDPAYKDVLLGDPTLLGVDSIKGSQIIYPVQFKPGPTSNGAQCVSSSAASVSHSASTICCPAIRFASTTRMRPHRMPPRPARKRSRSPNHPIRPRQSRFR